jgi:hypothetical protein
MLPGQNYEPQKASDVFAMYQSLVNEAIVPEELLWNGTPPESIGDYDALMDVLDWELNVDPNMMAIDSWLQSQLETLMR